MAGTHATRSQTGAAWSGRLHTAFSVIAWCAALNALWMTFTLLGGVVLGVGPATVAACIVTRRRLRGESIRWRDFAAVWRKEFWRGTVVMLPVVAAVVVLYSNYVYFSALGPPAGGPRLVTLAALVLAIGAGSYVAPLYAHYDLPLHQYVLKAMRFALARPVSTFILVFFFAAGAFATAMMPALLAVISVGAWWQASTYLCLRFFQENEDRLARQAHRESAVPHVSLPVEPLRLR